jgi:nucleotide-binding universal stress UspA family protein
MMGVIIVGVDGSPGSLEALRFAIEEARIRGDEVRAVIAWHVPAAAYDSGLIPVPVDPEDYRKIAEETLARSLAEVEAGDVTVTPLTREGQAADVLVAESKDADLLVVGSRGLGGFKGLLLGSVSQQCAHHAACPVAIVRSGGGAR